MAFALLLTGCGSDAEQPAPDAAPKNTLDARACADLTTANLDLATAQTGEDARTAADVLGAFTPPADVQEAIDHIVAAGGVKFDGADFDLFNDHIDPWVRDVCPEWRGPDQPDFPHRERAGTVKLEHVPIVCRCVWGFP